MRQTIILINTEDPFTRRVDVAICPLMERGTFLQQDTSNRKYSED